MREHPFVVVNVYHIIIYCELGSFRLYEWADSGLTLAVKILVVTVMQV